jgi:hypothetical protein
MTRDDIEHMVREAGIKTGFVLHMPEWDKATWLFMRRFAVLVAAVERKAVLDTIDELMGMERERHPMFSEGYDHALLHLKEFVSARGKI